MYLLWLWRMGMQSLLRWLHALIFYIYTYWLGFIGSQSLASQYVPWCYISDANLANRSPVLIYLDIQNWVTTLRITWKHTSLLKWLDNAINMSLAKPVPNPSSNNVCHVTYAMGWCYSIILRNKGLTWNKAHETTPASVPRGDSESERDVINYI